MARWIFENHVLIYFDSTNSVRFLTHGHNELLKEDRINWSSYMMDCGKRIKQQLCLVLLAQPSRDWLQNHCIVKVGVLDISGPTTVLECLSIDLYRAKQSKIYHTRINGKQNKSIVIHMPQFTCQDFHQYHLKFNWCFESHSSISIYLTIVQLTLTLPPFDQRITHSESEIESMTNTGYTSVNTFIYWVTGTYCWN